ncbi:MAG: YeeE/YedE family protein [Kordiimonadaceae bacterium]|jgi:uncharacterized protein|nr:YeeE/YedE family protein [Kordiimonadaceae bacterium]MBT6031305.1 YeeE/YedE family protein [Kordiimonadaceae bacterium]
MTKPRIINSINQQKHNLGRVVSIIGTIILVAIINHTAGMTNALLSMVGVMIGITFVMGNFGFTGGWIAWINRRDGRGLRAQMLILALASALFYPILAQGSLFGNDVTGFVAPIGIAAIFGSFLFGIGMQFGGCCASGVLSWAGAGSVRIFITLFGFIAGSVWGAYDIAFWRSLPGTPINLTTEFGVVGGLGVTLIICAFVIVLTLFFEKRRYGKILTYDADQSQTGRLKRLVQGQWPIIAVILLLVLANFLTLLIAGRPWGVTSAFALWGSKALTVTGADLSGWSYWNNSEPLNRSIFFDVTSVMNIGIFLGSLIAAQILGTFKLNWNIGLKLVVVSLIGGLMLGYGSRIAYGCNIGAFFSGISSASLSGWIWFVSAFIGNIFGTALKKRMAL